MAAEYTEARIREARLIVACPEQVLAELEKYGETIKSRGLGGDENLEKSLLARGDPLIDLGLARYARTKEVVAAIYQRSCTKAASDLQERYLRGLRIACLSNEVVGWLPKLFPIDVLGPAEYVHLMAEGGDEELVALLSNPNLSDGVIRSLYRNEGNFAKLRDERRRWLVLQSICNPRLVTKKDSPDDPDLEYRHNHLAILHMLATAPLTEDWCITLDQLLRELDPGSLCSVNEPITPILERWAQIPISEDSPFRGGIHTALPRRDEFRCLVAAMYGPISQASPDSPDLAMRSSYYGKAALTEKEMRDGLTLDGDVYLLAVLCNESVFNKPALRKLLEDEQLHGELSFVYRQRCEQIHKRRPQFDPRPVYVQSNEEGPQKSKEVVTLEALTKLIIFGFLVLGILVLYAGR